MKFLVLRAVALASALRLVGRGWGVFTLAVLLGGLALALPAAVGLLALQPVPLAQRAPVAPQATVFIAHAASAAEARDLQTRVQAAPGVAQVTLLSRDAALADLLRRAGQDAALPAPAANPLPDVLIATFAAGTPPATVDATVAALRTLPRVDSVHADAGWYRKLAALGRAAALLGAALAGAGLLLALLTLVGAVRLLTTASAAEIRTLRLLGATDAFIRRPLVYTGVAALALAGGLAALLVAAAAWYAWPILTELAALYGVTLEWQSPPPALVAAALVAAALAGAGLASLAARAGVRSAR